MIDTDNYFGPLDGVTDAIILALRDKNMKKNTQTHQNQNNYTNPHQNTTQSQKTQKTSTAAVKKMPPINVFGQDTTDLIKLSKESCKIKEFHIKKYPNNKQAIITNNIQDYTKIVTALKQTLVQHYTYTPKQIKTQAFILRGLNNDDDTDTILADLKQHETDTLTFQKVTKFNTKNAQSSLFLVSISCTSAVKDLFAIKFVLYRCVKWERIRRSGPTQCYRCQQYGHTAGNCNMKYRCVKCAEDHNFGECKVAPGESPKEELYCVQCKKTGHPASYRGCPTYKEMVGKMRQRAEQARDKQRTKTPTKLVNNEQSFASLFRPTETTRPVGSTPTLEPAGTGQQQDLPSLFAAISQLTANMLQMQAVLAQQSKQIAELMAHIRKP